MAAAIRDLFPKYDLQDPLSCSQRSPSHTNMMVPVSHMAAIISEAMVPRSDDRGQGWAGQVPWDNGCGH